MTLTTTTTLVGLAAACASAWALGGRLGTGAVAGYLAGACVAGLALLAQRRLAASARPQMLAPSVMLGFLLKAFALLTLTLAVRYVAPLAQIADARSFLFGCGGAILLVLAPATLETLRALGPRRKPSGATVGEARPS